MNLEEILAECFKLEIDVKIASDKDFWEVSIGDLFDNNILRIGGKHELDEDVRHLCDNIKCKNYLTRRNNEKL